MPSYTVKQGDHLSLIADKFGFRKLSTIWEHPNNSALKTKRKDPHILFPGDEIFIPEKEEKKESAPTTNVHRFKVPVEKLNLRLTLRDVNDKPRANLPCTLEVDGAATPVTSNGDGLIEKEIPKSAKEGKLVLPDLEIALLIGHLDPIEEQSGQIARLNNLGYEAGDTGKDDPEKFKSAVEEFQCDQNMSVTGVCDAATQGKLKQVHGC